MREIMFRGKRADTGKWLYWSGLGRLSEVYNGRLMGGNVGYSHWAYECIYLDDKTIGQYTGLTDKNGKRIFEGDVIKSWTGKILAVKFGQYRDDEECVSGNGWYVSGEYGTLSFDERWGGHEVIGNIHDNPELMKEEPT